MINYLLTPPQQLPQARSTGLPLAHVAFQISASGQLQAAALPEDCRGGLMLVGGGDAPAQGEVQQVLRPILHLCAQRDFRGVVLDLEGAPTPYLGKLIPALDQALERQNRGFFLPESFANYSKRAFLYLSSALSGGSLRVRLEQALRNYGPERVVLSLHRSAEDFFLPAPQGSGQPMSQQALRQLISRLEPRVFFSQDLCAHYFTYMSRETGAHFVLFDDAASFAKKLALAREAGVQRGFLLYPAVADLLPELSPVLGAAPVLGR